MSAKKIEVTLYSDAAYYGGAEAYLSLLSRHLDRDRVRLSAILPDRPAVGRLESELARAGVAIRRHRRLGFRWWDAFGRLRDDLQAIGGEVLHINLPSTYDAGLSSVAFAARMSGYRRVVATEHLPMIKRRYRRFPAKFLFSEAVDLFLVPAQASRESLVRLHMMPFEKTRVVPLGVEEPPDVPAEVEQEIRRETDTPRGTLTLGVVGSLIPRKGQRDLLEALAILAREDGMANGEIRLWVIGEGEERPALEERARELGLGAAVRFLGPRPGAAGLMRLLDLLVVPSLVETTPFVVLEAMAASRPVVATRIFGIPEMVVDGLTGSLVAPSDPPDLARALRPLLRDPELRREMGLAGRDRYAALFTADRMARETEIAYRGGERDEP